MSQHRVPAAAPAAVSEATVPLTVAQHLAVARAAHLDYRRASSAQQLPQAKAAVEKALAAREAANALDPDRSDPVWVGEFIVHDEMVKFYCDYLARCRARGV